MPESTNIVRDTNFFAENASIGQFISVEVASESRFSFKTHLVGCKTGSYLVLEIPSIQEAGNVREHLVLDRSLIIRTICERTTGDCIGFYSSVLGIVRVPYPVLFASYPQEVETRELRTEKRQTLMIPALMYKNEGGEQMSGHVIDHSSGGCRFEIVVPDDVIKLKANLMHLRYLDPDTQREAVRLCRVCSQRKLGNRLSIGFAFLQSMRETG